MGLQQWSGHWKHPWRRPIRGQTENFWSRTAQNFTSGQALNLEIDTLETCRVVINEMPVKISQWAVLSFVPSVFDPLGLFAPFTMRVRILLKTIRTESGQQWAEKIDFKEEKKFLGWVGELVGLKSIPLKRRYFDENYDKIDLHDFSVSFLETLCIVA